MSTYPTQPDIPMGAAGGGDAKICGDANPENYIEPNEDGSVNVAIVAGDLTLSPTVTIGEGTASIGTIGLDAGSEVIGHVIVDTGSEVTLTSGATVGLVAGTEQIGHVITDPTSVTDLAAGATVDLAAGAEVALAAGTTVGLEAGTEAIGEVSLAAGTTVGLEAGTAIIGVVLPANASVGVPLGTALNAGPQVIHAGICYASGAIVTEAGGGAALSFYNHASDASGTIVGFIPLTATVGSYWPFNMPASVGIVAGIVDTSPAVTIAYSYTPTS